MTIKPVVAPSQKRSGTSAGESDKEPHQVANVGDAGPNALQQHRNVVIDSHGQVCIYSLWTPLFIISILYFLPFY